MRTTTCPFCGGNGRVTWIGLAMVGIWLIWVAFGRMLPDVWNGALMLSLPALALWAWSGRPPKRTPAQEPCGPLSQAHPTEHDGEDRG